MAKEKFNFVQPIKDIPKSLKGFPKNIKHLVKDPVTTAEEAGARKKEVYPLLYLCVGLCLVLALLMMIPAIEGIVSIIALIPIFGIIGCVFLLQAIKNLEKKFADLECPNCKTRIAYGPDVQYKVISLDYKVNKTKKQNSQAGVDITVEGKETATVEITCKCQECGTTKTFTETFRTAACSRRENVALITADVMLANFEKDIRAEQKAGFDGSTGAKIKYKYDLDKLVKDYFGNVIQM